MSSPTIDYRKLVAYAAGDLPETEASQIEVQLVRDPQAAATVRHFQAARAIIQSDDGLDPPAEAVARACSIFSPPAVERSGNWWEALEQILAALVFDSRGQLAVAGYRYRGIDGGFQLCFECEPADVELQVEPTERFSREVEPRPIWQVMGQIVAARRAPNMEVALVRQGATIPVAETSADTRGIFSLEAPSGRYDLFIRHGNGSVVLRDIDLS